MDSGAGGEGQTGMPGTQLGSYELIRRLGEGGMAQVYLARDVRLGREVAVKVLDRRLGERSGFRDRFLREAKLAAALDHPNIVQLYDFGEEGGDLYLVMPYMSGGSLQDKLSQAPFSVNDVVNYSMQIADARLAAADIGENPAIGVVLRGVEIEKRETKSGVSVPEPGGALAEAGVMQELESVIMPRHDIESAGCRAERISLVAARLEIRQPITRQQRAPR